MPGSTSSTCASEAATSIVTFESPEDQYQEFLEAESHGRYFLSSIRNQFRFERLAKLHAA